MANAHLATYLNDHLSGAVAALELLERLETEHAGSDLARTLGELRSEIQDERQMLKELMEQQQIDHSRPRQAAAWLAEKASQIKLRFDDPADGALRLFESLEAIGLGVEGKRSLWLALAAAEVSAPPGVEFKQLAQRSADQRARIEELRQAAARVALRDDDKATA
jgi:hypothetical protein